MCIRWYKMYDYIVFECVTYITSWYWWFTTCMLLTLYVDLVGAMGTCEADPSQIWQHFSVLYFVLLQKIVCVCGLDIMQSSFGIQSTLSWHIVWGYGWVCLAHHFELDNVNFWYVAMVLPKSKENITILVCWLRLYISTTIYFGKTCNLHGKNTKRLEMVEQRFSLRDGPTHPPGF